MSSATNTDADVGSAESQPTDEDLVDAIETLENVDDCVGDDGIPRCPICGAESNIVAGISYHASASHEKAPVAGLIGTDRWRSVLETLYGKYGLSINRIAGYLPSHTGSKTIQQCAEKFGIERAESPYGINGSRHPDDPARQRCESVYEALETYLTERQQSSVRARWLTDEVEGTDSAQVVGQSLKELCAQGRVERIPGSAAARWTIADDDGDDDEEPTEGSS